MNMNGSVRAYRGICSLIMVVGHNEVVCKYIPGSKVKNFGNKGLAKTNLDFIS